jgi:hypothetical protein
MMKKLHLLLSFLVLLGGSTFISAQSAKETKPVVEVYYFHATNRCPTCNSIEANTKKTLETSFSKELKEGKIKLTVLNSDEDKNKVLCEKYEAYGATLILVKYANGKETSENMTNFAFSYSRNQAEKFMDGLKLKIRELMK